MTATSLRGSVYAAIAMGFGAMAASLSAQLSQPAQQPFTLQQALSAPYSTSLTAAPKGALFAWVEDAEGRHNLWVGGPGTPARQLTHNTEDDAQDIAQLAWSPDATSIAYTYGAEIGHSGQPANPAYLQRPTALQVIIQPLADAAPVSIANAHTPLFVDAHTLLFLRDGKIWIDDLTAASSPSIRQLVYDRGSAHTLTLSPDGMLLAYVSTRHESGHPSHSFIALYDLSAHTLRFLAPSTGVDFAPSFSPNGKQLAWLRRPYTETPEFAADRVSANPWSIQLCDVTTNTTRMIYQPEPNRYGSVLPRMATGDPFLIFATDNRLVFISDAEDGWQHLFALKLDDPGLKPLRMTPGSQEIEDLSFDRTTNRLWFSTNFDGYDRIDRDRRHIMSYLLGSEELGEEQVTKGSGIETHPVSAGGRLAALVSDAHTPMHPALIAMNGAITPINLHTPESDSGSRFVIPEQVLFDSSDGLHLHGQLFEPTQPTSGKRAALIFVHGGPKRQMLLGFPAMDYYSNAYAMNQYLTSRGFLVLSVNYRCGIGYGLDFRQCEHAGANGGLEYTDVLAAMKYLRSRPDVDPKRIGIWGGSYGGYLTALALALNSDLFAAGVDFHGVHDWILEDNHDDWLQGSDAEQDAIAIKAHASSPLGSIDHWRSPVLLIHGDDDPEVAYAQTPTLADQLRARKVPMEELIFPDELHGFLLHKDWLAAYEAEANFFERSLKPQEGH